MKTKQREELKKGYEELCERLGVDFYCSGFFMSNYIHEIDKYMELLEQEKHSLCLTYLSFFGNEGKLNLFDQKQTINKLIAPKKSIINGILAQPNLKQREKEALIREIIFSSPSNPYKWGLDYERQAAKVADQIVENLASLFSATTAYKIQDYLLASDPRFKFLTKAKRYEYCSAYLQKQAPEANLDSFFAFLDTFEKQVAEQIKEDFISASNSAASVLANDQKQIMQQVSEKQYKEKQSRDFVEKEEFDEIIENAFYGIVGLDDIKKELEKIVAMNMYIQSPKPINILLTGNPGTGKSTVAEIMSEVLYMCGVTHSHKFTKITAADLQGQYVGQTIPKIQKVFADNRGGVIFLDEIYSLATDTAFSKDAVNELLLQLESTDNCGTVVIAAGYENKINDFFRANSGLKSRFSKTIHLKDYSLEQLMEIASGNIEENDIDIEEEALDLLKQEVSSAMQGQNFGNARYVKNAVEEISENAILRAWASKEIEPKIETEDVEKYIEDTKKSKITERKIGFN